MEFLENKSGSFNCLQRVEQNFGATLHTTGATALFAFSALSIGRGACLIACLCCQHQPTNQPTTSTTISPKRQAEHAHRLKVPLLVCTSWPVHAMPCIMHTRPLERSRFYASALLAPCHRGSSIYICEITRKKNIKIRSGK